MHRTRNTEIETKKEIKGGGGEITGIGNSFM